MPLGSRRSGRAQAFDVINNTTGAIVIRNITADEVAATYATSLSAEEVLAGVASSSFVDSDSYRVTGHMAILYTAPTVANALADQTGNETVLVSYQFAANSFEGPGLIYSAAHADGSPLPAWLTFDPLTRTFSGTPDEVATYTIRVTAREPVSALKVTDDFDWVISA